jgi:hypothetical protein
MARLPVREEPLSVSDDVTAIEPVGDAAYLTLDPEAEHDEVGIPLGPDSGGGIFDQTGSEGTLDREGTATAGAIPRPEFLRMAVLARIASWAPPPPPAVPVNEPALRQLQRALREEPLDPVPLPFAGLPPTRVCGPRSVSAPERAPPSADEREERTLTQLRIPLPRGAEEMETPPLPSRTPLPKKPAWRRPAMALAVLGAFVALVWACMT